MPSSVNVTSFTPTAEIGDFTIDLGWIRLGLSGISLSSLSYSPDTGWDFSLGLDVDFSFPSLPGLNLPTIEGVALSPGGLTFPELDLPSLDLPPMDFGGFGLAVLGFSMREFTFPWFSGGGGTDWDFDFDLKLTLPNLPLSFPEGLRDPDIVINDVGFSDGALSVDIPAKLIDEPGYQVPLGAGVIFHILELSGHLEADGSEQNVDLAIRGRITLPETFRCEGHEGPIDLGSTYLHIDGEGHIEGTISDIVPPCPLRLGPFGFVITSSSIVFSVEDGSQGAVLNMEGRLELPGPGEGETVVAPGMLSFDLVAGRLLEGEISISEPFRWDLPGDNPIFSFVIESALLNPEGLHISGSGRLPLGEGSEIGVTFNEVLLDLSNLDIVSGNISFSAPFAFKVVGGGRGPELEHRAPGNGHSRGLRDIAQPAAGDKPQPLGPLGFRRGDL